MFGSPGSPASLDVPSVDARARLEPSTPSCAASDLLRRRGFLDESALAREMNARFATESFALKSHWRTTACKRPPRATPPPEVFRIIAKPPRQLLPPVLQKIRQQFFTTRLNPTRKIF